MDWLAIVDYYYKEDSSLSSPLLLEGQGEAVREASNLRSILLTHSRNVADKALAIADSHSHISVDRNFVCDAAMLHDIGIILCDAPGIECHGTEPYIKHGLCGGKLLREYASEHGIEAEEIEKYARVCERHTGAGLTAEDILSQNLPLPVMDLLPETIEEQLICYADKFFSKTRPNEEKPLERVLQSMRKFGQASEERFLLLHEIFK